MTKDSRNWWSNLWSKHLKKNSWNAGVSKMLLPICGKVLMIQVNITELKLLQKFKKLPKKWIILQVFYNDYLHRRSTLYVNNLATCFGIRKLQKWPLQNALQHSCFMNRYKRLKNTCDNLLMKLLSVGGKNVYCKIVF